MAQMKTLKRHKDRAYARMLSVKGALMTRELDKDQTAKQKIRTLRRARRYIRANEGALARVLNTYARMAALDPARQFWAEQ